MPSNSSRKDNAKVSQSNINAASGFFLFMFQREPSCKYCSYHKPPGSVWLCKPRAFSSDLLHSSFVFCFWRTMAGSMCLNRPNLVKFPFSGSLCTASRISSKKGLTKPSWLIINFVWLILIETNSSFGYTCPEVRGRVFLSNVLHWRF